MATLVMALARRRLDGVAVPAQLNWQALVRPAA